MTEIHPPNEGYEPTKPFENPGVVIRLDTTALRGGQPNSEVNPYKHGQGEVYVDLPGSEPYDPQDDPNVIGSQRSMQAQAPQQPAPGPEVIQADSLPGQPIKPKVIPPEFRGVIGL